jgi:hypothetical protein
VAVAVADVRAGTYVLQGRAHVSVSPFPTREAAGEVTAVVSRRSAPRTVGIRLESQGYACSFEASLSDDGSIQGTAPATCSLEVAQPEARGHVELRIQSLRGVLRNDTLELRLEADVRGRLQLHIPATTMRVLGIEVPVSARWAPAVPVSGRVSGSGTGPRQRQDSGS